MPGERGPAANPEEGFDWSTFVEEILTEALRALTQHMSQCNRAWDQGSAALRSGDLARQNRAIDNLILLREKWSGNED
jgi:hypothetical protein